MVRTFPEAKKLNTWISSCNKICQHAQPWRKKTYFWNYSVQKCLCVITDIRVIVFVYSQRSTCVLHCYKEMDTNGEKANKRRKQTKEPEHVEPNLRKKWARPHLNPDKSCPISFITWDNMNETRWKVVKYMQQHKTIFSEGRSHPNCTTTCPSLTLFRGDFCTSICITRLNRKERRLTKDTCFCFEMSKTTSKT